MAHRTQTSSPPPIPPSAPLRKLALALAVALTVSISPFAQQALAVPLGWDLVGGDGELTYKDESSYPDEVRRAVDDWNQKGVKIREAKQGETPEVTLRDQQMGADMAGLTHSHGEIGLNPDHFAGADPDWKKGTIAHELGHALGLDHDNSRPSVMNTDGIYDSGQNTVTEDDAREGRSLTGSEDPSRKDKTSDDHAGTDTPSPTHDHPEKDADPTGGEDGAGKEGADDSPRISSDAAGKNTATPTRRDRADSFADEDSSSVTKGGKGRDYFADEGSDVFSITDGTVKGSPDGKKVEVEADDDAADGGVRKGDRFLYSNVDAADEGIRDGDRVKAGQKIGKVKPGAKEKQPPPPRDGEEPPESDSPARYSHDHFNVRHYDPSGERAEEESTGEMGLAPLLDREEASPKSGGANPKLGRSSSSSSSCDAPAKKADKSPKQKSKAPANGRGKDRRGGGGGAEDRPTKKAAPAEKASCPDKPPRDRDAAPDTPESLSKHGAPAPEDAETHTTKEV